jgi:hypothetical protein
VDESLIRELVSRILASPQIEALLKAVPAAGTVSAPEKKDCLVVLDNEASVRLLPEIKQIYGASQPLQLCSIGAVNVSGTTIPHASFEQAMGSSNWSKLLIPVCSRKQLAAMASGQCPDKVCELAAQAILTGIPVEIGRVEYGFTDNTPDAYRKLFAAYEQQLAGFGVSVGRDKVLAAAPMSPAAQKPIAAAVASAKQAEPQPWSFGEPVKPVIPDNCSTVTYTQGLMTEKEAILLPEHAILQLGRATVLTPSAIDTLKKQKVQVFKEGVRFM